jgi:hypothetical protein
MSRCHHDSVHLPVSSLDEIIEFEDGSVNLIEQFADPDTEDDAGSYRTDLILDLRRFLLGLPVRLFEIAYRTYWLNELQDEKFVR